MSAQTLILDWLKPRMAPAALAWLEEKAALLAAGATGNSLAIAFGSCVRHAGKAALDLDAGALDAARRIAPGWNPSDWTCDQAARVFLLLSLPPGPDSAKLMDTLFQTADMGEAVALEKALAVLAYPEGHMHRAREAIRSNIKQVFDAVALRNPYACLHFDEVGWNQMVVKTFFVDSPLTEVEGLDRRANPALARMLADLALERWAAGRSFSPQLWRCVGPYADARALAALEKALKTGPSPAEKRAAALALASCPDALAARILEAEPALAAAARDRSLTWENLGT